jgi:hypothetical protein
MGLSININYDSSVGNAPAAFRAAINYVVNFFESIFTNPITINIDVGFGEVDGLSLPANALGASIINAASSYTYTQIRSALVAGATLGTGATLPVSDLTHGGNLDIGRADAKALGLLSGNSTTIDGWVGFSSIPGIFTFDPNNRAVPSEYDFIGTAFHEISEVMGRVAWLGNTIHYPNAYSAMDLFRYSAAGVHQLVGGHPAYFSIDGGNTNLGNFNTNSNGDLGDWAAGVGNDAFLAFSNSGIANVFSSTDIKLLGAIGWQVAIASVTQVETSPLSGNPSAGQLVTIKLDLSMAVTVAGGMPTLTLNDGGVATYDARASNSTTLAFDYTVGNNDQTTNLAIVAVNEPAGTTITDVIGGRTADFSNAVNGLGTGLQIGTVINATILGGAGNDTFYALATNLAFDGGGGHDTLVLDGARSQYSIITNGDGSVTVWDSIAHRDGSHHLLNVENLQFTNQIVFVENSDNANIARLYSAALGRPPDTGGLNGWEDAYANLIPASAKAAGVYVALAETPLSAGGGSIAGGFTQSLEFQQKYGTLSDAGFVTQLYQNVLGRGPDAAGFAGWLDGMANHGVTRDMVLVGFAESPENIAKVGADWLVVV